MGKKKPKNGYGFFYAEIQQNYIHDYKVSMLSDADKQFIADQCAEGWRKMHIKEKKKYEDKAIAEKNGNIKKTAQGRPVLEEMAEAAFKLQKQEIMQQEIKSLVSNIVMQGEEVLVNTTFHCFHMNALAYDLQKQACPAEIGLTKFNIKDGIVSTFHALIRTRPIPVGYSADAKDIIEKTHGLPWLDSEIADGTETDPKRLYVKILKFFGLVPAETHERAVDVNKFRKLPMLFTTATEFESTEILEASFKSILIDAGMDELPHLKIYSVEELCQILHTACVEHGSTAGSYNTNLLFNKGQALLLFKTDPYSQSDGITCSYHEEIDKRAYCSLSKAQRWSFMVLEHCFYLVGVKPKLNKHLSVNTDLETYKNPYEKSHGRVNNDFDRRSSQFGSISDDLEEPVENAQQRTQEKRNNSSRRVLANSFDFEPVDMELSVATSRRYSPQSDAQSLVLRAHDDDIVAPSERPPVLYGRQRMYEEDNVVSRRYYQDPRLMERFRPPSAVPPRNDAMDMRGFASHLSHPPSGCNRNVSVDRYTEKSMSISASDRYEESEEMSVRYRPIRQENAMYVPIPSDPYVAAGPSAMSYHRNPPQIYERSTGAMSSSYYTEMRSQSRKQNAPPMHSQHHFPGLSPPQYRVPQGLNYSGRGGHTTTVRHPAEYDIPSRYMPRSHGPQYPPYQQYPPLGAARGGRQIDRGTSIGHVNKAPSGTAFRAISHDDSDDLSYDDDSTHLRQPLRPIPLRGGGSAPHRGFRPIACSSRYGGDEEDFDDESITGYSRSTNPACKPAYKNRQFSDSSSNNDYQLRV